MLSRNSLSWCCRTGYALFYFLYNYRDRDVIIQTGYIVDELLNITGLDLPE